MKEYDMSYNSRECSAEVDGLVERLSNAGHGGSIVPNPRMCREAARALTAQQADNAKMRKADEILQGLYDIEKARAEKAEAERDAAEEREFNRGYLIACCNLTNLHDMPEVGFDVLRELGLRKAQVDGFGLSEYDAEALRNIEKGRAGSVYVDDASAKLKGGV